MTWLLVLLCWLLVSLAVALAAVNSGRLRRYDVVLHGNSATNEGYESVAESALTRRAARRRARRWNGGETGTGIIVARVERRRRG